MPKTCKQAYEKYVITSQYSNETAKFKFKILQMYTAYKYADLTSQSKQLI